MNLEEMCFVFGSNEAGIHGGGAAYFARMNRAAKWGHSYGYSEAPLPGNNQKIISSFAIPTKGFATFQGNRSVGNTLPLARINRYVQGFLAFAEGHPEINFQVTCIGCGLAGLAHKDIAPMFDFGLDNLWFDEKWKPFLKHTKNYWGEG